MRKLVQLPVVTPTGAELLLPIALAAAVPLIIRDLLKKGGPTDFDRERASAAAEIIGAQGDQLLYKTRPRKGDAGTLGTAELFNQLAFGLAVLSFCPGGVKFMGLHYEARQ